MFDKISHRRVHACSRYPLIIRFRMLSKEEEEEEEEEEE
jgi:hypothetical protein